MRISHFKDLMRFPKVGSMVVMLTAAVSIANAQQIPKDQFQALMSRMAALNYWAKAPAALMLKCGDSYPDARATSQRDYLAWQSQNAEFNRQVSASLATFEPFVAATIGKSNDDYQVFATKIVDEEVAERFFNATSEPRRHNLCVNFSTLLSQMMSTDLAKPRVSIALQELPQFRKYVQ